MDVVGDTEVHPALGRLLVILAQLLPPDPKSYLRAPFCLLDLFHKSVGNTHLMIHLSEQQIPLFHTNLLIDLLGFEIAVEGLFVVGGFVVDTTDVFEEVGEFEGVGLVG